MANELQPAPLGYRFAEFEFHARTGELRRQGQDLKLPDQAGRVLLALLRASGAVVTREELKQALWPGRAYGDFEGGLNAAVRKLRLVLDDDGSEPRLIGTFPKRGYRLLVPSERLEESSVAPAPAILEGYPERRSRWWLAGLFRPASGREFRAMLHWAGEPVGPVGQHRRVARPYHFLWLWGLSLLALSLGALAFSHYWRTRPRPVTSVALPGGVKLELVHLPAGEFAMGYDTGYRRTEPVHRVKLTQGCWMGATEVTQDQWRAVMGNNPSHFQGDAKPVEQVSWDDCQAFCKRLNALDRTRSYRLPTEAEWEYAARAGRAQGSYEHADTLAWHCNNSGDQTHAVAQKEANPWGLFDTVGNVWEWCSDGYAPFLPYPQTDPQGPAGELRSARGGSWLSPGSKESRREGNTKIADRATLRYGWTQDYAANDLGFRVVAVPRSP